MEGGGAAADPAFAGRPSVAAAGGFECDEETVRAYCDDYKEAMKGQTGRDLLFDFKDIHKNLPLFGLVSDVDILEMPDASQLQIGAGVAALVQGALLGAHLEGTSHETKLSTLTEEMPSSRP